MKVECAECGAEYIIINPKDGFKPAKCKLCGSDKIKVTIGEY